MTDAETLAELVVLFNAEKAATTTPDWVVVEHAQRKSLKLSCPLWIDGAIVSGLRMELQMRALVPHNHPFFGFTAMLLCAANQKPYHLARVEIDPENSLAVHRNPMGIEPPAVRGRHEHPFKENAARGLVALSPKLNLPVAREIVKDFLSFDDVLAFLREAFVIPGLWLETPPCTQILV